MKVVSVSEFSKSQAVREEACRLLRDREGLVCFPCSGTYRLCASLLSEKGVMTLLQTKRRSGHRPALVLVLGHEMLCEVVGTVPAPALQLIQALWPGKLTLKLPLSRELPRKVYRDLAKADGKVGVRQPESPVACQLLQSAGVPLLVSSANQTRKAGASSVALIRKQFGRSIGLLIDNGDLAPEPPSTIVELDEQGQIHLVRAGAVSEEAIRQACTG